MTRWWPWTRRRAPRATEEPPVTQTGAQARVEADEQLRQAREQLTKTKRLADAFRVVAERNHFGESMIELFRGVIK